MLVIEHRLQECTGKIDETLYLTYEDRSKSRLHCFTADGQEVGIFLSHGQAPLADGELLQAKDGRIIKIVAEAEELLHVTCSNHFELTRAAYHLGNRHITLQIGDGWLRILNDYVIKDMLIQLGATVTLIKEAFNPETGAYHTKGHHHVHSGDKQFNYTPKIHEFGDHK